MSRKSPHSQNKILKKCVTENFCLQVYFVRLRNFLVLLAAKTPCSFIELSGTYSWKNALWAVFFAF